MKHSFLYEPGVILTIILAAAAFYAWNQPPAGADMELARPVNSAAGDLPDAQDVQSDQTLSDSAPSVQTAVAVVTGLFVIISLLPLLFLDDSTDRTARRSD